MKKLILGLLASKKFVVTVTGYVAAFVVPVVNKKFGVGLSETEVAATLASIASIATAFIIAQATSDIKTNGATSGVVAATATTPPLPPEVQAILDNLPVKK